MLDRTTLFDALNRAVGKDHTAEAEAIHRRIQRHAPGARTLLDVACGTGQHAAALRDRYDVTGLDIDTDYLAAARARCPEGNFVRADMVDFDLGTAFDAVVCLCSSIGYAHTPDRLHRAIARMAAHLRDGGVLFVEPWFAPGDYPAGQVRATFVDEPELKLARMNVSEVSGRVSVLAFEYLVGTPDGVSRFTERHELGLFTPEEYLDAMRAAGLEATYDPEGLGVGGGKPGLARRGLLVGTYDSRSWERGP